MTPIRRRRVGAALCVAVIAYACEALTAGFPGSDRVSLDETIEASISSGGSVLFHHKIDKAMAVAGFLQVVGGDGSGLSLDLLDGNSKVVGSTPAAGDADDFHAVGSGRHRAQSGEVMRLRITSTGYQGAFRAQLVGLSDAPEDLTPSLSAGVEVVEGIDPAGDIDTYELPPSINGAGLSVELLDALGGGLEMWIGDTTANEQLIAPSNVAFGIRHVTRQFAVPVGGAQVRIQGMEDTRTPGRYRLRLLVITDAPEDVTSISFGDSLGEALDLPDDVDEFVLPATGDFATIRVDLSQLGVGRVRVLVKDQAGQGVWGPALVDSSNSELWTDGLLRVLLTQSYTLRISDAFSPQLGRYAVQFDTSMIAPEANSELLMWGDTVFGNIQAVEDVDRFRLPDFDGEALAVVERLDSASAGELRFQITSDPVPNAVGSIVPFGGPTSSGTFGVTQGEPTRIWLNAERIGGSFSGAYSIRVYAIDPSPEIGPDVVALGDTIHGVIDPPGDIDIFKVAIDSGRIVVPTTSSVQGPVSFGYFFGGPDDLDVISNPMAILGGFQARRSDTLFLYVAQGGSSRGQNFETGNYSVVMRELSAGPENVSNELIVGDTLIGEIWEHFVDVDQFVFDAVGGSVYVVRLDYPRASPNVAIRDSAETIRITSTRQPTNTKTVTPHFIAPFSGTFIVQVKPGLSRGSYSIRLNERHPAPETISAAVTVGDIVSGESMDHAADLDEYTFTAPTAGRHTFWLSAGLVGFEIAAQGNPDSVVLFNLGSRSASTTKIDLPFAGSYLMRLYSQSSTDGLGFEGPYSFSIQSVNIGPETVSPNLLLGDSVSMESIDFRGDVDRFNIVGTANQSLSITFRAPGSRSGSFVGVTVIDDSDGSVVDQLETNTSNAVNAKVTLPSDGTYSLVVEESDFWGVNRRFTGPYRLYVN